MNAILWSSKTRLNSHSWDLALWWYLACDDGTEIQTSSKERALEIATSLGLVVTDKSVPSEPAVVDVSVDDLD